MEFGGLAAMIEKVQVELAELTVAGPSNFFYRECNTFIVVVILPMVKVQAVGSY